MALPAGDLLFVDTNVLLTATDESRPQHWHATQLLGRSGRYDWRLAASGQILREYTWSWRRAPLMRMVWD